jgi:hypothetical protein
MTIYSKDTKVGRIVPGCLHCSIEGHEDMYVEDSEAYNAAYRLYDDAGNKQKEDRKANILLTFRKLVQEHKEAFPDEYVTKMYLNYRDAEMLYQSYREELRSNELYLKGCDSDFICDGIQIKKGCDNDKAKVAIHSTRERIVDDESV